MSSQGMETLISERLHDGKRTIGQAAIEVVRRRRHAEQADSPRISVATLARESEVLRSMARAKPEERPPLKVVDDISEEYLTFFQNDKDQFYRRSKVRGALYSTATPSVTDSMNIWDSYRTESTEEFAEFMINNFHWQGQDKLHNVFSYAKQHDVSLQDAREHIASDGERQTDDTPLITSESPQSRS